MRELAERFFARFSGLTRAHGEYVLDGTEDARGKKGGKGTTVHTPLTVEMVESHLKGEMQVGICPIRDDSTCRFGAVDIDAYLKFDIFALADQVAAMNLPLVVCRTKSGGAHLYLFTSEDTSAEIVRLKLMEWAVALGYSGVEIFPKQARLAGEKDFGNWINLPYQDSDNTERYAVLPNKTELTLEGFLAYADKIAISAADLKAIEPPQSAAFKDAFEDGPPCLQTLAVRGFGEGSRNNALFDICVLLRKKFGDSWKEHVDAMNTRFFDPPLGHKEVEQVMRSASRKDYMYKCSDTPISLVCNRQICLTRKFGIGGQANDPGVAFGPLIKLTTEPVIWFWDVNGKRIELSTADLKDQMRFHTRVIDELNIWPQMVKGPEWAKIVREKLEHVEILEAPPESRTSGQIWAQLEKYLIERPKAKAKDELLMSKPWIDPDTGLTHIRAPHFQTYLEQNRIRIAAPQLWSILREGGAQHLQHTIKQRTVSVWAVPSFKEQDSDFEVPRLSKESDV